MICGVAAFWTKPENRRLFFDEFAKSRGFDPLLASNWYDFISDDFIKIKVCICLFLLFHTYVFILFLLKGGSGVLKHYDGSYSQALLDVYPFIGLEALKFKFIPSNNLFISFLFILACHMLTHLFQQNITRIKATDAMFWINMQHPKILTH